MLEKLQKSNLEILKNEILGDYRLAYKSRQASLIGRREVLSGRAKFGIFGDGKELAQIAMAKFVQPGDFRAGYYRDQTLLFATGDLTLSEYFAQLYADPGLNREPASGGRSMNAHFSSRLLDTDGRWKDQLERFNNSPDVSPTASQMPRLVGLAYASRLYRNLEELKYKKQFSSNGNEIAFGTIGNASIAEGMFWESLNAISVLKSPAVISIWDDDYGISVSNRHQFGKSLSDLLSGFSRDENDEFGYRILTIKGWDYFGLIDAYRSATRDARERHIPALVHVIEMTQPQGHSTSGSHERYKSTERLEWEAEHDCLNKFRKLIIEKDLIDDEELEEIEREDLITVEKIREEAWVNYKHTIRKEIDDLIKIIHKSGITDQVVKKVVGDLQAKGNPLRKDILEVVGEILRNSHMSDHPGREEILVFKNRIEEENIERYSSHLYSQSPQSALNVPEVAPVYSENSPTLNGFEILNKAFDNILSNNYDVIAFGEDLGKIGGVNQGFAGLQKKYGDLRVSDTGIRETTIIGQAIGMALRGLRPIAEIQYLDYLLYALQIISDDLATIHWRSVGGQKAPVIIRTRGHRLEGIWHSGSPLAGIINLVRGIHVMVPRNMVQAAAFYNTLIKSDEPGLIIEVLNGYRLKETLPDNIGEITNPVGAPEVIREGRDITVVTYGPLCQISIAAANLLEQFDISAEIIDVRTLLPFDLDNMILESLKKTNRILFLDEDVPGGTTAYMMQKVLEEQGGYYWLDSEPRSLSSKPHRPAYGSDGNYFSKPNRETIFEAIYGMMHDADPGRFPNLFG
jgi:pyruvate/2-oxoglutarate/acetoin dehydrogenase E1 component/TPP-dependent pyruvate/acetoin dehydrogenase alpha subunit